MAREIMTNPEEIQTLQGQKLPLKMQVEYMSFSAHVDYRQISGKLVVNFLKFYPNLEFVRAIKPPHIVLVHGEANEMGR